MNSRIVCVGLSSSNYSSRVVVSKLFEIDTILLSALITPAPASFILFLKDTLWDILENKISFILLILVMRDLGTFLEVLKML